MYVFFPLKKRKKFHATSALFFCTRSVSADTKPQTSVSEVKNVNWCIPKIRKTYMSHTRPSLKTGQLKKKKKRQKQGIIFARRKK